MYNYSYKIRKPDISEAFAPVDDIKETAKRVAAWSMNFLGDPHNRAHYWIRSSVPPIHMSIYQMLAEFVKLQYLTSPRDFAKTTVDCLVWPLYCIYYELEEFIVMIGKIDKTGKRTLRNIMREVRYNPKIKDVYGDLSPDKTNKQADSAYEAKLNNGIFLRSIGMMGDIRGDIDDAYRPTLIILDDPQAVKVLREPSTLEAHEEWFDRDVIFAMDSEKGKLKFIGNLISRTCLLAKVIKDKRFTGINFSALVDKDGDPDINGRSIWEARHSTKKLHDERDSYTSRGKRHVFMLERMNIIVDEFSKNIKGYQLHRESFKRLMDQNVLISDEHTDPVRVNTYLAIDPAFADTESSDERALVAFAKGRVLRRARYGDPYWFNCLWVLEYLYNHMSPHHIIDEALKLHRKYYFEGIIVEQIGGAQILEPLMTEAKVQDTFFSRFPFSYTPVPYQPANKKHRIYSGLDPRAKLGQIFVREEMVEIINEMEDFDMYQSPHLLDALEMGNRYSIECTDTYSNVNEVMQQRIEQWEEQFEESSIMNAPRNLSTILGS